MSAPRIPSFADGVDQTFAAIASVIPARVGFILRACRRCLSKKVSGSSRSFSTPASGVGQIGLLSEAAVVNAENEDALSFLREAVFRRREESSLNRATQSAKVSPDTFCPSDLICAGR
jgi:hypothetical protein